jgi:hypothetical membrane protein
VEDVAESCDGAHAAREARVPALQFTNRNAVLAGAWLWIAKLEFFAAEFIAAAAWPGYSLRDSTISLLGTNASPSHWLMNGGLVAAGLLTVAGAQLTGAAWPQGTRTTLSIWLITIAGIGTVGIGVWPVDSNEFLHVASTLTCFVPGSIGVVLLGLTVMPTHKTFGIFTVLAGVVSLGALALFAAHFYLGLGHGGMERVAGYASTLWYVVAGIFLLTKSRS